MWNDALCYQQYGAKRCSRCITCRRRRWQFVRTSLVQCAMRQSTLPSDSHYRRLLSYDAPSVAGYEGVGVVVEDSTTVAHFWGNEFLPYAALESCGGLDIDPRAGRSLKISMTSCAAHINPLTAMLMLTRWPVAGKQVLLTAASSSCASLPAGRGRSPWARVRSAVLFVRRSTSRAYSNMASTYLKAIAR